MHPNHTPTLNCTCDRCGKRYYKRPCLIREINYCSNACRRDRVVRTCDVCGEQFEVKRSCAERGHGRFCSRACTLTARATGLIDSGPKTRQAAQDRFLSKIDLGGDDECWPWNGNRTPKGYGSFSLNRRMVAAHRVSWTIFVGPIPDGLHVLHACDTPFCVNPKHLFLGTNQDNIDDKVAKRRQARGETHSRAILTEDQVREIRYRARNETISHKELGHQYGVSKATISGIVSRKNWRHI